MSGRRPRGFTLLECLVALAIVAVALGAASRAVGSATRGAQDLRERMLAGWVAENRLAELRATAAWPALGEREGEAEQAGQLFVWRERVSTTPNPLFLRVDVDVFRVGERSRMAGMSGFLARPLQ